MSASRSTNGSITASGPKDEVFFRHDLSSGLVPVVVARAVFAAMEAAVAVMVLMVSMVSMVLIVLMALLAALAALAALAGANLLSATDLPGDTWSTVVGVSGCSSSS